MSERVEEEGPVKEPPQLPPSESSPPLMTEGGDHASPGTSYHLYPSVEGSYEDIVGDGKLFMKTLEKLHLTLGTKFMVPTVGGKELDLHRLFVEVTSRGGIEKVVKERRWKEVTAVFSFPSTATNASYVLRKYYVSLLHHYEQIYFFKATGWSSATSASQGPDKSSERLASPTETPAIGTKRKKSTSESAPRANVSQRKSHQVVGIIDGKFDHGYLVTVWIGGQKLQGVLYHVHEKCAAQAHAISSVVTGTGTRRRRRKRKLSKLDPTHPKPNRSGYNFFFAEQHARLKPLHQGKDREISRKIGELWNKLTESEKAVYQDIGLKDKERYQSEMVIYRERQRVGQTPLALSAAVPIRQHPSEAKAATPEALPESVKSKLEEENSFSSPVTLSDSSTESDSEVGAAEIGTDSTALDEERETTDISDEIELPSCGPNKDPEEKKEEPSVPTSKEL